MKRVALPALALLVLPVGVRAHATVHPSVAPPGAWQRYLLRVPTERDVATLRVEITFPDEVRVVSLAEVPGWSIETRLSEDGRIVGAVWTGRLPPRRFAELPFVAVNPAGERTIAWPVAQVYADGERVEWTGPEGSQTPASVTRIEEPEGGGSVVPWAALALALISLGVALRPRGSRP